MEIRKDDYKVSMAVQVTPQEAFENINNVSDWWTASFEGRSEKSEDVFTVRFGETFVTVKIVEFIPYRKLAWHVMDCNKHWLKDRKEWKGTTISWEISAEKNATHIHFTHIGLVPGMECYETCEKAWDFYIREGLLKWLTKGKVIPGSQKNH